MPSADTFDVEPIKGFVQKYLMKSKCSVDLFARNKRWATYTNDLNPDTAAQYHMDAEDFAKMLHAAQVRPDLIIFDPPYSPRQVSEMYSGIGRTTTITDTQMVTIRKGSKNVLMEMAGPGTVVLSFGWNSSGMGFERGFEIIEILLVCHGSFHNDTICMAERRLESHPELNFPIDMPPP